MTIWSAQGVTLCKKGDVSEADRDVVEAREDFWSMSGFIYRHHFMPTEQLYVPKESEFPVVLQGIDVVRQTQTNLDSLEESNIDFAWSIDGHSILSENLERICAISNPEQTTIQGHSWVDGRLTKKSSPIKIRNDLARSMVVDVQMCSEESEAAVGYVKTPNTCAEQEVKR